jgi:hypothetical protein
MLEVLLKVLELIEKAANAKTKRRRIIFEQFIDPLYHQLAATHDEFTRALRAIQKTASHLISVDNLYRQVAEERSSGRAARSSVYAQAAVFRDALYEQTQTLTDTHDRSSSEVLAQSNIRYNKLPLPKTVLFSNACASYFEQDGIYMHELRRLETILSSQVERIRRMEQLNQIAENRADISSVSAIQSEKVMALTLSSNRTLAKEIVDYCDYYIEFRCGIWEAIAKAYAECRLELLTLE